MPISPFIKGDFFEEESSLKKRLRRKKKHYLTWSQVAWMICENVKANDTDESVLDLNEISKVQLEDDSVQSFCTRWDEKKHSRDRRRNSG